MVAMLRRPCQSQDSAGLTCQPWKKARSMLAILVVFNQRGRIFVTPSLDVGNDTILRVGQARHCRRA